MWRNFAVLLSLTLGAAAPASGPAHPGCETVERDAKTRSRFLATASPDGVRAVRHRAPWPVALKSIGHTIASYQSYGRRRSDVPDGPYFHSGLDIRADAGSAVRAARGGKVVNLENYVPGDSAYWEIAILDDDGYLWQYHHVNRGAIPEAVVDAAKHGGRVADGAMLGTVYTWPISTFGERYHHVHLNVLGAGGVYLNGFSFLEPLADNDPPEVVAIGILKNGKPVSGASVRPPYSLYAEVRDLVLHTKFFVPPNLIAVSVDGSMERVVWEFSRLPGGASSTDYVHDFYVKSMTCGNYECRRATVDLGFGLPNRIQYPAAPGPHTVEVIVTDDAGNRASKTFDYRVESR